MQEYFVKTKDKDTANYLRQAGFTELPQEDGRWVFLNDVDIMTFSQDNIDLKLNYSNVLCV